MSSKIPEQVSVTVKYTNCNPKHLGESSSFYHLNEITTNTGSYVEYLPKKNMENSSTIRPQLARQNNFFNFKFDATPSDFEEENNDRAQITFNIFNRDKTKFYFGFVRYNDMYNRWSETFDTPQLNHFDKFTLSIGYDTQKNEISRLSYSIFTKIDSKRLGPIEIPLKISLIHPQPSTQENRIASQVLAAAASLNSATERTPPTQILDKNQSQMGENAKKLPEKRKKTGGNQILSIKNKCLTTTDLGIQARAAAEAAARAAAAWAATEAAHAAAWAAAEAAAQEEAPLEKPRQINSLPQDNQDNDNNNYQYFSTHQQTQIPLKNNETNFHNTQHQENPAAAAVLKTAQLNSEGNNATPQTDNNNSSFVLSRDNFSQILGAAQKSRLDFEKELEEKKAENAARILMSFSSQTL